MRRLEGEPFAGSVRERGSEPVVYRVAMDNGSAPRDVRLALRYTLVPDA